MNTEGYKSNIPFCALLGAAGARNICVGFTDVTRESLRIMSCKCYAQNLRTMCIMYPAYIMQMLRTPAARGARNKGCYVYRVGKI
jgi:hypothetical protein